MAHSSHILPTYTGFIGSTYDAAILFKACTQGLLPRLTHRPAPICRGEIARSGHVFIFEEKESDIQRWTDDLMWSPSRGLDGFLLYRQVGERGQTSMQPRQALQSDQRQPDFVAKAWPRLYGSLIDSYQFKEAGLMKKMISVKLGNACWRLVSYYLVVDVLCSRLLPPSKDLELCGLLPQEGLWERHHYLQTVENHTPIHQSGHNASHADYWLAPDQCFQHTLPAADQDFTKLEADDDLYWS